MYDNPFKINVIMEGWMIILKVANTTKIKIKILDYYFK